MKLTKDPCQIVGVRLGELEADVLAPERALLRARFVLLRDPSKHHNQNAGRYTKERDWSENTHEKFREFIAALEEDAMKELFVLPEGPADDFPGPQDTGGENLKFPDNIPTLGDSEGSSHTG